MKTSTIDVDQRSIVRQLDKFIQIRKDTLLDWPEKSADDTADWLAMNFLFSIGCDDLGFQTLEQLNIIVRRWTSPDPLRPGEFTSLLQRLRELVVQQHLAISANGPHHHHSLHADNC